MANKLVFLFSPQSQDCIDTWKILKENNILQTLIKINVDDPKNNIPSYITTLPTLLIRGQNIIAGKEAIIIYFNITNKTVTTNQNNISNTNQGTDYNPNINGKPSQNNNNNNNKSLPPLTDVPFSKQNESMFLNSNELGGHYSDNYGFIDESVTQQHSFEFINDSKTSSEKKIDNTRSVKKSALEERMESMMSQRNEIKPFKRI